MIVGEGTATVGVSPREVFEFVLDLNRYRQADHKIGRVGAIKRDGGQRHRAVLGTHHGHPEPVGHLPVHASPPRACSSGRRSPGSTSGSLEFDGTFDCETTDAGTVVVHREAFTFKGPLRWILEPLLRRWLAADTKQEMVRFKEIIER